ncbi:hypothetical protein BGZ91_002199, partial [Linnemannia elongata]
MDKFYVSEKMEQFILPEHSPPKANRGDAAAQYNLGLMYKRGKVVPRDFWVVLTWFIKAAGQGNTRSELCIGHADAQNALILQYLRGKGVLQSLSKGMEWYMKVVNQGPSCHKNWPEIH